MAYKIINDRPAKISDFECTTFGEMNKRLSSLERTKHFLIQKQKKKKDLEEVQRKKIINHYYQKQDLEGVIIDTQVRICTKLI